MQRLRRLTLMATAVMLLLAGCRLAGGGGSPNASGSAGTGSGAPSRTAGPADGTPSAAAGSGVPLADVMTIDWERLRAAFLGDEPYPSGWEAEVDRLIEDMRREAEAILIPDVTGMDATAASCAVWAPLVGHTGWATGALLERQAFIAYVASLAGVAPEEIEGAAREALAVASAAAAEQLKPEGDPAIVSEHPSEAIETIGRWAVEHCDLPVRSAEPPDTEDWTAEDIALACDLDRSGIERAQEAYRAGPGDGRYAEHPHLLEVTVRSYAYPQWHSAIVDNAANPPTLRVEPIPGGFCDT